MVLAASSHEPLSRLTQLIWGLIPLLVAIGALRLLVTILKRRLFPKLKGRLGEWTVNRALAKKLDSSKYHVLHNLLLPDGKGGLTQIDHVVVSAFGIFVIETKNWDCWIYGTENDYRWTLKYPGGGRKVVLNPLNQNALHVRAIQLLLNVPHEYLHNLVFINPVSKIMKGPIHGVFTRGMLGHIRSFTANICTPEEAVMRAEELRTASLSADDQAVALHLQQVTTKQR